jgi:hypothetical protein
MRWRVGYLSVIRGPSKIQFLDCEPLACCE